MNLHISFGDKELADHLAPLLAPLTAKVDKLMATLDDVLSHVQQQRTVTESIVSLVSGLSQQLKDAVASEDPAKIQAVIDALDQNTATLSAAVTANTPVAAAPGSGQTA